MDDVELHLPPDVAHVGIARLVVTSAARQCGLDDGRVEDLRIAVSEATTNAILAHQRVDVAHPVVLAFGAANGRFKVTIQDAGPGFEPPPPEQAAARDWTQESGLGVTLIRGLADEVAFRRGEGTAVHMTFAVTIEERGATA